MTSDVVRYGLIGAAAWMMLPGAAIAEHNQAGVSGARPPGATGWTPTGDGMAITSSSGQVLLAFNRWSNSLLVTHRASGVDLQLKRGGPGAD